MICDDMVMPVGTIFKPHGYKGEVNVDIHYDTYLFDDRNTPFFIKIDNILVPFFVEYSGGGPLRMSFLKFKGIDSDLDASTLNKKSLYALKTFLAEKLDISVNELEELGEEYVNYSVSDEATGDIIGTVVGIEEGVEYDYLIVNRSETGNQISIPLIDEFIKMIIDKENNCGRGEIKVSLPEGFLDI